MSGSIGWHGRGEFKLIGSIELTGSIELGGLMRLIDSKTLTGSTELAGSIANKTSRNSSSGISFLKSSESRPKDSISTNNPESTALIKAFGSFILVAFTCFDTYAL
jgi:hypothetical protein